MNVELIRCSVGDVATWQRKVYDYKDARISTDACAMVEEPGTGKGRGGEEKGQRELITLYWPTTAASIVGSACRAAKPTMIESDSCVV